MEIIALSAVKRNQLQLYWYNWQASNHVQEFSTISTEPNWAESITSQSSASEVVHYITKAQAPRASLLVASCRISMSTPSGGSCTYRTTDPLMKQFLTDNCSQKRFLELIKISGKSYSFEVQRSKKKQKRKRIFTINVIEFL